MIVEASVKIEEYKCLALHPSKWTLVLAWICNASFHDFGHLLWILILALEL
jgi:hypothetical protein